MKTININDIPDFELFNPLRDIQKIGNDQDLKLAIERNYEEIAKTIYVKMKEHEKFKTHCTDAFCDETNVAIKHGRMWWKYGRF